MSRVTPSLQNLAAGNAVTPPAAEVIVSALVEAITGEPVELAASRVPSGSELVALTLR